MLKKQHFISRLLDLFNVSEFSSEFLQVKYNNGLLENIDFERLYNFIENQKLSVLPSINELNKIARDNCFITDIEEKCDILKHIESLKQLPRTEMKDFDENLKDKIRSFLSRYDKKPEFDL